MTGTPCFDTPSCDVPTTLLLYNCVFAYVNDKFTYFFVCALLFGFLMIEPLLR